MIKDYIIIPNKENEEEGKEYLNSGKKIKKKKRILLKEKVIKKYIIEKLSLIKCLIIFIFTLVFILIYTSLISKLDNEYYKKIINIININTNNNDNITDIINNNSNMKNISDNNIENISENNIQNISENNIQNISDNKIKNISDNNNIIENNIIKDKSNIQKNKENIQNSDTDLSFEESKKLINKNLYKEYKFNSLQESFNKAKDFLDKSSKGILINDKKQFKSSENPKVTAIIPVYNSQYFITRAIKSIQNQNLLDLEIILVNDFSTDRSLNIIEEIKKEDPRIKIINNKKNM